MRLSQIRKTWSYLSQTEKESLIEATNVRRIEAFNVRKAKATKKKAKTTRKKSTSKRAPKTPEGLLELTKNMTPEERKNFELMIQTMQHGK